MRVFLASASLFAEVRTVEGRAVFTSRFRVQQRLVQPLETQAPYLLKARDELRVVVRDVAVFHDDLDFRLARGLLR